MPVDQYIGELNTLFYIYFIQDFMKAVKVNNTKINDDEPFKGLFTQGMVCHETYKNTKGDWLSPDQMKKI